jgi:hypothetical protein
LGQKSETSSPFFSAKTFNNQNIGPRLLYYLLRDFFSREKREKLKFKIKLKNKNKNHNIGSRLLYLLRDFFSRRNGGGGAALARVVRLDDGLAVADAAVRHERRQGQQSVTCETKDPGSNPDRMQVCFFKENSNAVVCH